MTSWSCAELTIILYADVLARHSLPVYKIDRSSFSRSRDMICASDVTIIEIEIAIYLENRTESISRFFGASVT